MRIEQVREICQARALLLLRHSAKQHCSFVKIELPFHENFLAKSIKHK